ncbi:MAG: acyl carrier protein [Bacteroidia bacterium]|nr:acyl carrier protein [Bacteroidia bacterium]
MPQSDVSELRREIKVLILETLKIDYIKIEEIEDSAPLFITGLGLDSIDSLEIIVALQRKYNIRIDDRNLARVILQSVNSIAEFIEKEKAGIFVN